jgi:hypothetical protein
MARFNFGGGFPFGGMGGGFPGEDDSNYKLS